MDGTMTDSGAAMPGWLGFAEELTEFDVFGNPFPELPPVDPSTLPRPRKELWRFRLRLVAAVVFLGPIWTVLLFTAWFGYLYAMGKLDNPSTAESATVSKTQPLSTRP